MEKYLGQIGHKLDFHKMLLGSNVGSTKHGAFPLHFMEEKEYKKVSHQIVAENDETHLPFIMSPSIVKHQNLFPQESNLFLKPLFEFSNGHITPSLIAKRDLSHNLSNRCLEELDGLNQSKDKLKLK